MRATRSRDDGGSADTSRAVGLVVGLLLVAIVAGAIAAPVTGHAYLAESSPESGESLDALPEAVTLEYTGDGVQIADVTVTAPNGENVVTEVSVDGANRSVVGATLDGAAAGESGSAGESADTEAGDAADTEAGDAADDEAGDAANDEGVYTVEWEVLADDGHTTSGSFFFVVGEDALDREQVLDSHREADDDGVPPLESFLKGLLLLGVLGLIGLPTTIYGAVYPALNGTPLVSTVRDRSGRLLAGVAAVTTVAAFGLGLARLLDLRTGLTPATVVEFASVPLGRVWLAQTAIAAGGTAAVVVLHRRARTDRALLGAAVGTGLALGGTIAWSSHSAVTIDRLIGTWFNGLHLVGAGLWLGGLAALALVALPAIERLETDDEERVERTTAVIERFSLAALAGVSLAVLTGAGLFAWHVPSESALATTTYGAALAAKVGVLLVAFGLGAFARTVVLRRLRQGSVAALDTLRAGVRVEVVVLVAVVLLAGVVTSVAPAAMVLGHEAAGTGALSGETGAGGETAVELSVTPGSTVSDRALVVRENEPTVFDVRATRDGEPLPDADASLYLYHPHDGVSRSLELDAVDEGTYGTVHSISRIGGWEVRVDLDTADGPESIWFDMYVILAEHDHHVADDAGDVTEFGENVRLAGLVVGVLGLLALAYEAIAFVGRRR